MYDFTINGMRCYTSSALVETKSYQRRKNKNKRINKKWLKIYGCRTITSPKKDVYVLNSGEIIGHPDTINKLRTIVEETINK